MTFIGVERHLDLKNKQTNNADLVTDELPLLLAVILAQESGFVWREVHGILGGKRDRRRIETKRNKASDTRANLLLYTVHLIQTLNGFGTGTDIGQQSELSVIRLREAQGLLRVQGMPVLCCTTAL